MDESMTNTPPNPVAYALFFLSVCLFFTLKWLFWDRRKAVRNRKVNQLRAEIYNACMANISQEVVDWYILGLPGTWEMINSSRPLTLEEWVPEHILKLIKPKINVETDAPE